jgi:acetyltransferase
MLEELFNPSSVAVIGASRNPEKVGHQILRNLIDSGYLGQLYPVNLKEEKILGLDCFHSVTEITEKVDLTVIAIPAQYVLDVAEECGEKKVKGMIVISAGFKETGREGTELERQLVAVCQKHGIRLLGPNCLGVIDTFSPMNASFSSKMPLKGNIAFLSQSGAICTAVLDWSLSEGIGFSRFVSLGNKADLDETDLMLSLADHEDTRVILIYLEGVNDGAKWVSAARKVTRKKPVIVVKSGVSSAGARAISSHTGSMAGSDIAYDAAFRKGGVIRATTLEGLFDLALVFSSQPRLDEPNVVILTNAGGPGILATDACEKYGLRTASFGPELVNDLRLRLPLEASLHNPVDVLGDAAADRYGYALEKIMEQEDLPSVITILTPQAGTEPLQTAERICALHNRFPEKPIVASFLGGEEMREAIGLLQECGVPNYPFPERAVYALSVFSKYYRSLESPAVHDSPKYDINRNRIIEIIKGVRADRRVSLLGTEAKEVALACGIQAPLSGLARSVEEAVGLAKVMGYPVALKVISPQILHKTDIGGVMLGLPSSADVEAAFGQIMENASRFVPDAIVYGIEVQKMAPRGKEMIIGVHRDPQFGPLLMFGLGGIYVNFLKDVSFSLAPISRLEASSMIFDTKAYTLLRGIRGEKPSDIESVEEVLLRISQLVTEFPEIEELDINPLLVYGKGKGSLALDVKITISPAEGGRVE